MKKPFTTCSCFAAVSLPIGPRPFSTNLRVGTAASRRSEDVAVLPDSEAWKTRDPRHAHYRGIDPPQIGEGAGHHELLEAYPQLTNEDIQAVIAYAADTLVHEETVLFQPKE
jgi:hypothetical protein